MRSPAHASWGGCAVAEASVSERVERALTDAIFLIASPLTIGLGGASGAAIFAALQWARAPALSQPIWLAVHLVIVGFHTWLAVQYRAKRLSRTPASWGRLHTFALLMSGLIWGTGAALYFDASEPIGTAFLFVFFSGLSAICVIAFAANFRGLVWGLLLPATALVTLCFLAGTSEWRITGIACAVFNVLCLVGSRQLRAILVRNAELRFANEDLAENLRVAYLAKNRFLAAASHDLRQPLHAMNLFVELLGQSPDASTREGFLQRVQSSSHALEGLLNSLLDLSRIDSDAIKPQRRHFPLSSLFEQLALEFHEPAERRGLTLSFAPTSEWIDSDAELLGRVLRNLVSNAIRYSEQGTITVSARHLANTVELSVADTGLGIPAADQTRVFEEFFQVGNPQRDREQGLGLGLSIVKGLCRSLQHPLRLTSQPQRAVGTEVTVEVPRGIATTVSEPTPVLAHALAGRRVLVLDDERDIRLGMQALLGTWQCTATCMGSLKEALESTEAAPDLVVCDFRLSDANGPDALSRLEEKYGTPLRAVVVTGETSPERVAELKRCGRPVLFKPVLPGKLRATLSALQLAVEP